MKRREIDLSFQGRLASGAPCFFWHTAPLAQSVSLQSGAAPEGCIGRFPPPALESAARIDLPRAASQYASVRISCQSNSNADRY